jgi:hypothetical protein
MGNFCFADIQVTGRRECIQEFINILDYKSSVHFSGMRFNRCTKESALIYINGLIYTQRLSIICDDSIELSLTNNLYKYGFKREDDATTIEEVSKRLSLDIEVWSKTPDLSLLEHIHVQNGNVLVDESGSYTYYPVLEYFSEGCNYQQFVEDLESAGEDIKSIISRDMYYDAVDNNRSIIELFGLDNAFKFKVATGDDAFSKSPFIPKPMFK